MQTAGERRYGQAVFERLVQAMDVLLAEDSAVPQQDNFLRDNYEIREDGAWLISGPVDSLNWVPACDLTGPDAPDPLSSPALPFPFSAGQLAAFMLAGWGAFLADRYSDDEGQLDEGVINLLLSGVRDGTARQALFEAFTRLAAVQQQVASPDARLKEVEDEAHAAYRSALDEAERLHDWRQPGLGSEERDARVKKRNEAVAAVKARMAVARLDREAALEEWRRAVVARLLGTTVPEEGAVTTGSRRVPLMEANRRAVLASIKKAGFDPRALPPFARGKTGEAKRLSRQSAGLSRAVFDRAWQELLNAKEIAYASSGRAGA